MYYTTNYKLNLPQPNDQFDITHFNENATEIDSVMKGTETNLDLHMINTSNPHGATSENTIYRIIIRDNNGNAKVSEPLDDNDISNKVYTDTKQKNFDNLTELSKFKDTDELIINHTEDDETKKSYKGKLNKLIEAVTVNTFAGNEPRNYPMSINALELIMQKIFMPTGVIQAYMGVDVPVGWFLCNGEAVSRTEYKDLFEIIGTKFGSGDNESTFNLPDLRESTLVGAGQNDNNEITAHDVYNLGEFKDDQMQGHVHGYYSSKGSGYDWNGGGQVRDPYWTNTSAPVNDGTNGVPRTGTTTHGKQMGVNYIIKY